MPIQPENKVTPFLIPPSPEKKDDLLKWAQDINLILNQVNRQLVTSYNNHLDQGYGHPKSWATWKIPRPSYKSNTADTSQVLLPASSAQPVNFLIGGSLFQATSQLVMDLDTAGPGGLRSGLSKAANTAYYLYAVNNSGAVSLLADTNDPNTGPSGYSDWSYVGAFVTAAASAVNQFSACNGFYSGDSKVASSGTTTSTTLVQKSLSPYPTTIKMHYGEIIVLSGTGVQGSAVGAGQGTVTADLAIEQLMQVSGDIIVGFGFIPALDGTNVWIRTTNGANTVRFDAYGWIETPTDFK